MTFLLPCPFCGNELQYQDLDDTVYPSNRDGTIFEIVCNETYGGCSASILGRSEIDCITKWNKRSEY